MAIKSANKRGKIGKKLIISYMIVLIVAFLVVGVTFKIFLANYLLNQAKKELKVEGERIAQTLSKIPLERERVLKKIQQSLADRKFLRVLGRYIDADIVVLDNTKQPIYVNVDGADKKVLSMLRKSEEFKRRGYVVVRVPIKRNSRTVGYVALLTKVKELNDLNSIRFKMLLISFLTAAIIALIVSLFLERSLVNPIMKLRDSMNNFSIKKFSEINLKTKDEIEELANSFNTMAKKLKSYDEQQKRFLQNASHELKTPLMSIQGYAEAIKDGIIEENEVFESLDIIINESQRLKKLVEEIIYLTKLENIEEVFKFEKVNINEIAENAVKSVNSLAMDKEVEIKFDIEDESIGNYDVEKMKRVFINLIGNAIRYAKKNILISIRNENNYRVIEVIDDGCGFKNDEDKKIFERFYKGKKGDSGIGLAIAQAIVKGHGGTIYAYNHESLGAVFRIELPKFKKEK